MNNTATPAECEVDITEREQADEALRLAVMALGDVPTAVGGALVPAAIDLLGREGGPEDTVQWAQQARELVRVVCADAADVHDALERDIDAAAVAAGAQDDDAAADAAADIAYFDAEIRRVRAHLEAAGRARFVTEHALAACRGRRILGAEAWRMSTAAALEKCRRAYYAGQR